MIDLNGLVAESVIISKKRTENGGTESFSVQNLLKHCATEVVEAMEAYVEHAKKKTDETKKNFVLELADVVCCCMIVAGHEDIDLEKAIEDCVEKNRLRAEGKGDKKFMNVGLMQGLKQAKNHIHRLLVLLTEGKRSYAVIDEARAFLKGAEK